MGKAFVHMTRTLGTHWGVDSEVLQTGGAVTTAYIHYSYFQQNAGCTLGNIYHYFADASVIAGTVTKEWVFYSANSADSSLLGKLRLGSNAAPSHSHNLPPTRGLWRPQGPIEREPKLRPGSQTRTSPMRH